jgi:hypothetical protein
MRHSADLRPVDRLGDQAEFSLLYRARRAAGGCRFLLIPGITTFYNWKPQKRLAIHDELGAATGFSGFSGT